MKIIDKSLDFWVGSKNKISGRDGGGDAVLSSPKCESNTLDRVADFFDSMPTITNAETYNSKAVYKQCGGIFVVFDVFPHDGVMYFTSIRYFENNGFELDFNTIKTISDHATGKFNDFLGSLKK